MATKPILKHFYYNDQGARVPIITERPAKAFKPRAFHEYFPPPRRRKAVRFAEEEDVQTFQDYLELRRSGGGRGHKRRPTYGQRPSRRPLRRVATPYLFRPLPAAR